MKDDFDFERHLGAALEAWEQLGDAAVEEYCREHPEMESSIRQALQAMHGLGVLDTEAAPDVPRTLGDFQIIQRLGGGGMGVVYRARQMSLGREVALKLIRPELMYFPQSRKRFQREVQAAARLHHPGIVPVHAVGEENGLPYYAMEWVRGCTLAEILCDLKQRSEFPFIEGDAILDVFAVRGFLDSSQADTIFFAGTWREVCLRIMKDVCQALEHAHRRGVLHRDIKPSNIMLTPEGRVLLVDFGLASSEGMADLTRSGSTPGSLPYMAPELLRGESAHIRSDVYSLGVTLYELWTSRRPYRGNTPVALQKEIETGSPPTLRNQLEGLSYEDEAVCLTAMEADPAKRYVDVLTFARELDRALLHEPVQTQRLGARHRFTRWVRRHPMHTLTGILTLLLVGVVPGLFAWREYRHVELEATEKLRAQKAEERAKRAMNFILGWLSPPILHEGIRLEFDQNQWIDSTSSNLKEQIGDDPELQIPIQSALGLYLYRIQKYAEAKKTLEEARALALERIPDSPEMVKIGSVLARIYIREGELGRALVILEHALEIAENRKSKDRAESVALALLQVQCLIALNERVKAAETLELVLDMVRELEPNQGPLTAATLTYQGDLCDELRQKRQYYDQAKQVADRHLPVDHPWRLEILISYADLHLIEHRYEECLALIDECNTSLGQKNSVRWPLLGKVHYIDANVDLMKGDFAEAESLLKVTIKEMYEEFPNGHPIIGLLSFGLGKVYLGWEKLDDANRELRRSLTILRKYLPENAPDVVLCKITYASSFLSMGELDQSQQLLDEAYQTVQDDDPTPEFELGTIYQCYAQIAVLQGHRDAGLNWYLKAESVLDEYQQPRSFMHISVYQRLGRLYFSLGNLDEAERYTRLGLEVSQGHLQLFLGHYLDCRARLGAILFSRGNQEEGFRLLQQAHEGASKRYGPGARQTLHLRKDVVEGYFRLKRYEECLSEVEGALKLMDGQMDPKDDLYQYYAQGRAQLLGILGKEEPEEASVRNNEEEE